MSERHHHILDRFLQEHADQRDALVAETPTMPDEQRQALLEVVRQGIPRRPRRRRRTVYEDELAEKQMRRTQARTERRSGVARALIGLGLRILLAVGAMVALAVGLFWVLDRISVREAERAGSVGAAAGATPGGDSGGAAGLFAPIPESAAGSNAVATPGPGSVLPGSTPANTPANAPANAPDLTEIPREELAVRLAQSAAKVPPNRTGVRVEFDPPPPNEQLRKRLAAPVAPLMFRRVRIVQNDKGLEVTDRWDGSFYEVTAQAVKVADIDPVARQQALELPGVTADSPAALVLTGKGTSFTLNTEVRLRLELVLTELPSEAAPTLRNGSAQDAFGLWLANSRLFGEATLESGARVVFEALPAKP